MDFPYLAKVAKLNIAALAALAGAPPPPEPKVEGAVSTDTTITWDAVPEAHHDDVIRFAPKYLVRWRRTDANQWQISREVTGACRQVTTNGQDQSVNIETPCKLVLPHIRVDDWVFGVSSVSKDGFESPVASAVPGGAFKPYVAPPAEKK
jgi:hypothetical protein